MKSHCPQTSGTSRWTFAAIVLTSIVALAGCESQQQQVAQKDDNLAAAGFTVRPANTPERQDMLSRLQPFHFVRRVQGDTVTYVYADPLDCDCLYVGSQQAYNQYRFAAQQKRLANEQRLTAESYSDAAWNWGAWGPWGPEYAVGPGPGW